MSIIFSSASPTAYYKENKKYMAVELEWTRSFINVSPYVIKHVWAVKQFMDNKLQGTTTVYFGHSEPSVR